MRYAISLDKEDTDPHRGYFKFLLFKASYIYIFF